MILFVLPRLKRHSFMRLGLQNIFNKTIPETNPPICAQKATPPAPPPKKPPSNCNKNQYPSIKKAGTTIRVKKKPKKISICTGADGNNIAYAPMTPPIAPEAPTMGTGLEGVEII